MHRSLPVIMLSFLGAASAAAPTSSDPALTIYRSDSDGLFDSGAGAVADGYAVVHEQRTVQMSGTRQPLVISGLPAQLDTEAIAVDLGANAHVRAQRVLSGGDAGALAAHRSEHVQLFNTDGKGIADGTLVSIDGDHVGVRTANDRVVYVRDYAVIDFPDSQGLPGSTLQLVVDGAAGAATAKLTYPTSGLGWRAAYSALLAGGAGCSLQLDALASIANRSGRDYASSQLKLIAGAPNLSKSRGGPQPMMMMKAMAAPAPAADELPEQAALGDYRSYLIDDALDLPDASVTQVPLYASREVACTRTWLLENGSTWRPAKPNLMQDPDNENRAPIASHLSFVAADNLPSGHLRVVTRDHDGNLELLGSNRIGDIPKGRDVDVALGVAFDLSASRERTAFSVDKGAREMDEGFRIVLNNGGDSERIVTLREHPDRWRTWTLQSSSEKPSKQSPDLLEFKVTVPANGKATLDYAVRYTWTTAED